MASLQLTETGKFSGFSGVSGLDNQFCKCKNESTCVGTTLYFLTLDPQLIKANMQN